MDIWNALVTEQVVEQVVDVTEFIRSIYGEGFDTNIQAQNIVKTAPEASLNLANFETFIENHQSLVFAPLLFQKQLRRQSASVEFWKSETLLRRDSHQADFRLAVNLMRKVQKKYLKMKKIIKLKPVTDFYSLSICTSDLHLNVSRVLSLNSLDCTDESEMFHSSIYNAPLFDDSNLSSKLSSPLHFTDSASLKCSPPKTLLTKGHFTSPYDQSMRRQKSIIMRNKLSVRRVG
jgi:hypothetical protein